MVDAQDYGFDKSRFPKLEDESFDCVICSEVVRAPKECTACGSLFCASCINAWLLKTKECPNRCPSGKDGIKPIGKALLRMYNDLDVQCAHFDKCKQTIKLVDLDKHEKICQLAKCGNFELCNNSLQNGTSQEACSPECLVIMKMKAANGDWGIIHRELKGFLSTYGDAKAPKPLVHSNSDSAQPMKMGSFGADKPIAFKWDKNRCGAAIQLTENESLAFLKENPYIFKTVLGDQGFMGGVHFWEIHADSRTQNELKIGVSLRNDFDANSAFCDFEFGYAYYGLGQLRHSSNANGGAYGEKFKKEGVLGVCLDMNKGTLSFGLNGKSFGVAFNSPALKKGPIYPAIALLHCAGCKLVSGKAVPQYFLN